MHPFRPAFAIKVVIPRLVSGGGVGDSDVAGGQQFVPLLALTTDPSGALAKSNPAPKPDASLECLQPTQGFRSPVTPRLELAGEAALDGGPMTSVVRIPQGQPASASRSGRTPSSPTAPPPPGAES